MREVGPVILAGAALVLIPGFAGAQHDAPGDPVVIPGASVSNWSVNEVPGRFGRPTGSAGKVPAVLILHGSGGVDGRGAFHARALQEAGIATLEITMFPRGGRPRGGQPVTLPYAAAALKWLGGHPDVHADRLGVMGFSWGGVMSVLIASELVQEQMGKDVPRPTAFAPLYPVCSGMARFLSDSRHPLFNAHRRIGVRPMLIHVGTDDDYELGERACDSLVAMFPEAARELTTVRYLKGATHGFDSQTGSRQFYDEFARGGRGGKVYVDASRKHAEDARQAIVQFFVTHLKP